MEVYIGRPSALEVHQVKIIPFHLLKASEEGSGLVPRSVAMAELLPISNTAPGVLSAGNGPRSKHYVDLKKRNKGVKKNSGHKDKKEER